MDSLAQEDSEATLSACSVGSSPCAMWPENQSLVDQVYAEQMADLLAQLEQCRQGTHPKHLARVKQLEEERRNRVNEINCAYLYEVELAEKECAQEMREAEEEYQQKVDELKVGLLDAVESRREQYEHEYLHASLTTGESGPMTRSGKRKAMLMAPATPKNEFRHMKFVLPENDIEEDLLAIAGDQPTPNPIDAAPSSANDEGRPPTAQNPNTRIVNDTLTLPSGDVLRVGQEVTIIGRQMAPFHGIVTKLYINAVSVKHIWEDRELSVMVKHLLFGGMSIVPRVA